MTKEAESKTQEANLSGLTWSQREEYEMLRDQGIVPYHAKELSLRVA